MITFGNPCFGHATLLLLASLCVASSSFPGLSSPQKPDASSRSDLGFQVRRRGNLLAKWCRVRGLGTETTTTTSSSIPLESDRAASLGNCSCSAYRHGQPGQSCARVQVTVGLQSLLALARLVARWLSWSCRPYRVVQNQILEVDRRYVTSFRGLTESKFLLSNPRPRIGSRGGGSAYRSIITQDSTLFLITVESSAR